MALIAYCYMPDHVHFLAEGKARDSDCRQPSEGATHVRAQDYPFSGSSIYTLEQILDAIQLQDLWR